LGTVRGVALCMGDVARNIILDQRSWAVFAFNTKFYVIKDFTENYTPLSQARIGGLRHSGLTYLPDGIKVVANMLRGRNEQSKVLIVVSDFFPSGYKDIEEKLVENVRKAERSGVGIIGIGVKSRAVKNYFRFNCVIDTPYDLMKKFTKIFIQYSSTR
jgi:nitric oxide reductase activation protein